MIKNNKYTVLRDSDFGAVFSFTQNKLILILTILCSSVFMLGAFAGAKMNSIIEAYKNNDQNITVNYFDQRGLDEFSEENLIKFMKSINMKFPEIVLAQAKLESGNFTSEVFLNNNNLFGMKVAKRRITTHKGSELNHAKYDSWQDSVLDYALWQATYASKFKTEDEYYNYLNQCYSETGEYVNLLKKVKDSGK